MKELSSTVVACLSDGPAQLPTVETISEGDQEIISK